jgi:hypothetical protein
MVRNGNSISADFTEDSSKTIEMTLVSALLDNWQLFWGFLTMQDKYKICKLSENIKFISTHYKTG